MLIFTLPSWYKTEKYPENCIFIYEQLKELTKMGHKIIVLSVQPKSIRTLNCVDTSINIVDDDGIITYYTEIMVLKPSSFRTIYMKSFQHALKKLINRAKEDYGTPDLYYAHFSFSAGWAACNLTDGIPLVVQEHYSGLMDNPDKGLKKCLKETVEKASKFICVSEGLKNAVINITGEKDNIIVISNMINPCFSFCPLKETERFTFFSLGSLIQRKRFDLLICAFAEEFKNEVNIELRIGGSGQEFRKLNMLIKKYEMEDRIKLLGQLSREKTLEEFSKCNCFVLASCAETYGLVYREAMAVGRPIISTKHGGFGEDWDDNCGILIDIDDFNQLKAALRAVYSNYFVYDLPYISSSSLKCCSSTAVVGQLNEVFQRVKKEL